MDNQPTNIADEITDVDPELKPARKPGRPKGSFNKPKPPKPQARLHERPLHESFPHPDEVRSMMAAQINATYDLPVLCHLALVLRDLSEEATAKCKLLVVKCLG